MTYRELSSKEVICITDGARLGYICDLEFSPSSGCVHAFYLPDTRFFSFSNKPRYKICREWVEKYGEDLILVCRYEVLGRENTKREKK